MVGVGIRSAIREARVIAVDDDADADVLRILDYLALDSTSGRHALMPAVQTAFDKAVSYWRESGEGIDEALADALEAAITPPGDHAGGAASVIDLGGEVADESDPPCPACGQSVPESVREFLEREGSAHLDESKRFARLAAQRFSSPVGGPHDHRDARDHQAQAQLLATIAVAASLERISQIMAATATDDEAEPPRVIDSLDHGGPWERRGVGAGGLQILKSATTGERVLCPAEVWADHERFEEGEGR